TLAVEKNDIKVVTMSRVFGVSPCVMAGLEYSSGEWVVYMDADLQDPPEVIPHLIQKIRQDPSLDVVHTVRTRRDGEPALKLFVTAIGYAILNKFSSVSIPVEAGDFKLLSRRVVNQLVRLKEKRPFTRGLVSWVGFKQTFIPYKRDARFAGETHFSVFGPKVINNFFESALISFSSAPLKLAIFFGLLAMLIDVAVMSHALFEKFSGHAVPGWTAMMIVMLFFSGVQLFSLGMIGLYLFGIYEQTKDRPNYIVESTHGFQASITPDQPSQ
ncbi:MAG: glycosyltransferase, partial [Sedimentisphaerales bacterium]|nr:glycosyltransferase [Sedimentisphaerales bacterium]